MKKAWIPALAVVLLLAAAGAYWRYGRTSGPAFTGPVEKIRIANIGLYSNFNIIAAEKGFFKEHGLDAAVDEYDSGGTSIAALLSGKADVAIAADFVGTTNIFTHQNLRILAEVSSHDVWRLIARKDKGVKVPKDLAGKKIGVTGKTAGEFYLGQFLTLYGLSLNDVQVIDLAPQQMIDQIESGQIDATVSFEPNAYRITNDLADQAISWSAQGDRRTLALVYATQAFIDAHPEAVERYLAALVEAKNLDADRPAEARQILMRALKYDDAYMDYILPKIDPFVRLDQSLLLTLEDQARWIIGNGLTDRKDVPNYLDYVSFAGLEKADPSAVTIVH